MNARLAFTAATLLALPWAGAQNVVQEPQEDPVQKAIREFNSNNSDKPNEVTVVLDPVGKPPAQTTEKAAPETEKTEPAPQESAKEPVLVTGKPPADTGIVKETETPIDPPQETIAEEPAPKPQKGLAVRVEKLQAGTGIIDPSKVKLLAPFPAKPLGPAPAGWKLEASESAPPISREVELSPGKKITLKIRPQLLVPDADGATVFNIAEPGFEASLGYQQAATVGAILSNSIRQLDEESKQLGTTIDNLQQLLVSLPKPEPEPQPAPPKPEPTRSKR
jgi:hypothetical protein